MTTKILFLSIGLLLCALIVSAIFIAPLRNQLFVIASRALADENIHVVSNIAYGPHLRHSLDHYQPNPTTTDKTPIVIFYYGGGWTSGQKSTYHFIGAALAAKGFEVIIPDYRLYPDVQFPRFVEDAALVFKWVWHHLAKENDRPIIVMGHSAGAHIAALLAYDKRYLQAASNNKPLPLPAAFIGLAGPYAFDPTTWPSTKDIFSEVKDADQARPVHFANETSPPTLLFHGQEDKVVKLWNQQQLTAALKSKQVFVEANIIPDVGHIRLMLNLGAPFVKKPQLLDKIVNFINNSATATSPNKR